MNKRLYKSIMIPVTKYKRTCILTNPCPAGKDCMVSSAACNECSDRADYRRDQVRSVECANRSKKAPEKLYSNAFSK